MKITVNGLECTITREPTRSTKLLDLKGGYSLGTQSIRDGNICIDESLDLPLTKKVLKHELAHLFLYAHLLQLKESYGEEELCEFMALYSGEINRICDEFIKKWGVKE